MTTPDPDFERADLEVARIRDLAGGDLNDVPLERRVLARTLNRIDAGESVAMAPDDASAVGRRPSWVIGAAAAAVAIAIVLAVTLWPTSPSMADPPGLDYSTSPEAASNAPPALGVLDELARTAEVSSVPRSGDVQYIASYGWDTLTDEDEGRSTIRPVHQQWWILGDGSTTLEQRFGAQLRSDGTLEPDPPVDSPDTSRETTPPGTMTDYPVELSRDATTLRSQLLNGMPPECAVSSDDAAACLLEQVAWLASTYVLPSDLVATLWRMFAAEPGIRTLGDTTDRIGRPSQTLTSAPRTTGIGTAVLVLLIDPTTARPIGTETVTLESDDLDVTEPTVTAFTVVTEAAYVPASEVD